MPNGQVHPFIPVDRLNLPPILFGGLNTRVTELYVQGIDSPDMLNVDLAPYGSIVKRSGLLAPQVSSPSARYVGPGGIYAEVSTMAGAYPNPSNAAEMVKVLRRYSDEKTLLYSYRSGSIYAKNLDDTTHNWTDLFSSFTTGLYASSSVADFTDEGPAAATMDYYGDCLYLTNGINEPTIMLGADSMGSATQNIASVSVDGSGNVQLTFSAAHNLAEGDIIHISNLDDDPVDFYDDLLNGTVWHANVQTGTIIHLINRATYVKLTKPGGALFLPATGNISKLLDAVIRWPKGLYDAVNGTRGYPDRWNDPDLTAGSAFPYGTPDWPKHIVTHGEGVASRMFAWGFARDPNRIDYSELGAPYNFLKNDVMAASESAATTSPSIDGGFFYVEKGDGDRVVAVRELFGLIIVFKRYKTVIYQGDIGIDFRPIQTLPGGAVSDESVIRVGNDLYYWSDDGPRSLRGTQQFGDIQIGAIAEDIQTVINRVTPTWLPRIFAHHDPANRRMLWFVALDGNLEASHALVYYYPDRHDPAGRWSLFSGRYCEMTGTAVGSDFATDRMDIWGANRDGWVYQMDRTAHDWYDWNGSSLAFDTEHVIDMYYVTRWYDLEMTDLRARGLFMDVLINEEGVGDAEFYIGHDYLSSYKQITEIMWASGSSEGYWDYSEWNYPDLTDVTDPTCITVVTTPPPPIEDTELLYWDTTGRTYQRYRLTELARLIRFRIQDDGIRTLGIGGLIIDFRSKGTR